MEPGLLTFLATPFPDEKGENPGKHVHPMSGIPLGLGIHAAIVAVGGRENGVDVLRRCECSYESPVPFDEPVVASAEVVALATRSVRCRVEVRGESDNRLLMKGDIILVHSKDGAAQSITRLFA